MAFSSWVAPAGVEELLHTADGPELFDKFRSLPWHSFLIGFLSGADLETLKNFSDKILAGAPVRVSAMIDVDPASVTSDTLIGALWAVYTVLEDRPRDLNSIIDDVRRAWSARVGDEQGIASVAAALDGEFIQEATAAQLRSLGRAIDDLKMPLPGAAVRFGDSSSRKGALIERLLSFWKANVAEDTIEGFIGRHFPASHPERQRAFRESWTADKLDDLESAELRRLAEFVTNNHSLSPSGSAARRLLTEVISTPADPPRIPLAEVAAPVATRAVDRVRSAPPPPIPSIGGLECGSSRQTTPIASSEDASSSDEDSVLRAASTGARGQGVPLPATGPVNFRASFPALSPKLILVLQQGGDDFARFFEPLALDVTTKKDLYALLEYYKHGTRLIESICSSSGLKIRHAKNKGKLELVPARLIRPDRRMNGQLAYPATERIAPVELRRWMQKGSIIPFVEGLAAKAGDVHKSDGDGLLAREIMCTGLALAALLDEFHPNPIIFSSGVERMVRRLVVIEEALGKERKERAGVYDKNLEFMGLNVGPAASTRNALRN